MALFNRHIKSIAFLLMIIGFSFISHSQDSINYSSRKLFTAGLAGTSLIGSYILLDQLWYKNYPKGKFQFINDNSEWLQMDKAGHLFSSYTIGKNFTSLMRWSGYSENTSVWLGGSMGLIYLSTIELLDGRSKAWGFSYGDMIANSVGTSLFIAQEKIWKEQRIEIKFSYHPTSFAAYNPELLGRNFQQRIIKDYNGQTYWCSINVSKFLADDAAFPKWSNIAFGYGATNMLSTKNIVNDVNNFKRAREFYISFDADLTRVRWKKKWMKTTMKILSFIKLPSPTVEIRNDGRVKFHPVFF